MELLGAVQRTLVKLVDKAKPLIEPSHLRALLSGVFVSIQLCLHCTATRLIKTPLALAFVR